MAAKRMFHAFIFQCLKPILSIPAKFIHGHFISICPSAKFFPHPKYFSAFLSVYFSATQCVWGEQSSCLLAIIMLRLNCDL